MDQFGWPLVITIIVGVVVTVLGGLIVEFAKQFIPQMDEVQKAKVIKSMKLAVRSMQGVIWGLVLGVLVAGGFFTVMVMKTIELEEGFLAGGAPKAPPQHAEVPTGERKFTETGIVTIIVCGIGGGIAGYYKELWAKDRRTSVPPPAP